MDGEFKDFRNVSKKNLNGTYRIGTAVLHSSSDSHTPEKNINRRSKVKSIELTICTMKSYRFASIVVATGWISRSEHRGSAFQRSHHAALGDTDTLLLHRLQQSVLLGANFVEFVDAAHALVGENQRACFDAQLSTAFELSLKKNGLGLNRVRIKEHKIKKFHYLFLLPTCLAR